MNNANQKELELIKILIPSFKKGIKKELDPLFLEKFLEVFNSEELTSSHIELISLCLLKRFVENPCGVIDLFNENFSVYLDDGSKMQVLFYLEEILTMVRSGLNEWRRFCCDVGHL